jgi:hypothetical protein
MKTSQIIVLTTLMLSALVLAVVGVYAFAYGNATVTSPSTSNTGVYGNYPSGMMGGYGGMMDDWMEGNNGASSSVPTPVQNPVSTILGLVALGGSVIAGTGGLAYLLSASRNRLTPTMPPPTIDAAGTQSPLNIEAPYVSVSKTLTAEERKVLDVLVSHDGEYLQKYIRAETGLSRLKTHRIVSRLADRGIVTVEKSGNTNTVRISGWLQSKPTRNASGGQSPEPMEIEVKP